MKRPARTMPSAAIGTLIQKIQCHDRKLVRKPPSGGPRIGPSRAGMLSSAKAATVSDFGTLRRTTSRPTGIIIAPPSP